MNEISRPAGRCPNCDAEMAATAVYCSRCMARPVARHAAAGNDFEAGLKSAAGSADIGGGTAMSFSLTGLLLTITAIGVMLGIGISAPGMGISLAIFMIPAWIRTAMVVRRRKSMGYQTDAGSRVLLFVGSAVVTWMIAMVLVISCCVTFCAVCLGGYSLTGPGAGSEGVWILVSTVCTLIVVTLGVYFGWRIIAWRYRKDTDPARFKR